MLWLKPTSKYKLRSAMLLALVGLLSACSPTLPAQLPLPTLPSPPSVRTPLPSRDYSEVVREDIESWELQLKATPLISRNTEPLGLKPPPAK